MVLRSALAGVALVLLLGACGGDDDGDDSSGRVEVVASLYPLAFAAEQVGGDLVDVVDLTPAGAEPHDLELTTDQVDAIEDADLVLVLGHDFQPAVEEIAGRRDDGTIVVLDELGIDSDDPHVWLDPTQMQAIGTVIRDALVDLDASAADRYRAMAETFDAALGALDEEFTAGLADCERRDLVTAHDAFGWMADRYDLTPQPIAGLSPDEEPSAERIAELAELVETEGVTTIFTESLVSPRVAETLAREAGVATAVLDPIEGLADDADARADYFSLIRANLAELQEGLGCG